MGRKALWITMAMMVILVVGAWPAHAQNISGSPHDLTGVTFTPAATDEICKYCHIPHFPESTIAPLWNKTLSTATFDPYDSSTMDATLVEEGSQGVGSVSLACLSCHDGVTTIDSYGNGSLADRSGTQTIDDAAPAALGTRNGLLGTVLTDDHPVSIDYSTADADFNAESGTSPRLVVNDGTNEVPLYGSSGTVECASCHNPHDNTTAAPFLRFSNAGSAICLTCHDK